MPRRTAVVPMGRQFRRKRGATRRTRCLPGVLDVQSSLLFLSLSSLFFLTHRFTDVPFPFFPPSFLLLLTLTLTLTFTALYTFLPPTFFHLVSILERVTQLRAWCSTASLLARLLRCLAFSSFLPVFQLLFVLSLSPLPCGYLSFSYSGSPSFLPPGRTAAGSAKRSLDGDKGPSYRS